MNEPAISWNESRLGLGPLAMDFVTTSHDEQFDLVVLAADNGAAVRVPFDRIGDFFRLHRENLVVCIDVGGVHERLSSNKEEANAFRTLSRDARLIDLRLLDRQLRRTRGEGSSDMRTWDELLKVVGVDRKGGPTPATVVPGGESNDHDKLTAILRVFAALQDEIDCIAENIGPLPLPPMEPFQRSNEHQKKMDGHFAQFKQMFADMRRAGNNQVFDAKVGDQSERTESRPAAPPIAKGPSLIGHCVEVWSTLSIESSRMPGFTVQPSRLSDLVERAEEEYQIACATLSKNELAKRSFEWDRDRVERTSKGFPVTHPKQLNEWLSKASVQLCDAIAEAADIPRAKDNSPSLNPERWGCWAACDKSLRCWRQVYRMAEVMRIGSSDTTCRPRFETQPLLRSFEPNLAIYRSLGIPVFRARPYHVFFAGRVRNLPYHCLAELSLRRKYVSIGESRLCNVILNEVDPLGYISQELQIYRRSASGHAIFEGAEEWRTVTDAIFKTLLLGLPDSLATSFIRNEFAIPDMTEPEFATLKRIMVDNVVYELCGFLEDTTVADATSGLGLTQNEGIRKFDRHDDTNVSGRAIRNDLRSGRERAPINRKIKDAARFGASHAPYRASLGNYRGQSLGGRVTSVGTTATVRRHEVRMSVEDVMLAIAHELIAEGYSLLCIEGEEFVLEVPDTGRHQQDRMEVIRAVVRVASRRVLEENLLGIDIEERDLW